VSHSSQAILAIAFDLDGTLIDSAADIEHALLVALSGADFIKFDPGDLTLAHIRTWVGSGPDGLIKNALIHLGYPESSEVQLENLRITYDQAALLAPLDFGAIFTGIESLLETLQEQLPLLVVTNKPTKLAKAVLKAANLLPFFSSIYGADRPSLRKPLPTMLLQGAADLGISPQRLLMVGDSQVDLDSAEAAGCQAIFVNWGYGQAHNSTKAGHNIKVSSAEALLTALLLKSSPT